MVFKLSLLPRPRAFLLCRPSLSSILVVGRRPYFNAGLALLLRRPSFAASHPPIFSPVFAVLSSSLPVIHPSSIRFPSPSAVSSFARLVTPSRPTFPLSLSLPTGHSLPFFVMFSSFVLLLVCLLSSFVCSSSFVFLFSFWSPHLPFLLFLLQLSPVLSLSFFSLCLFQ